jgi:hypothetical protein
MEREVEILVLAHIDVSDLAMTLIITMNRTGCLEYT